MASENRRITIWINDKDQVKSIRNIRKEYRDLKRDVESSARGTDEYRKKTKRLRELKKDLDTHRNSINGVKKSWGGVLSTLTGSLGVIGGVALLGRALSNAFRTVTGFEQAGAQLAAVLGTTRDNTKALTQDAIRLGGTTAKTATEVTQLQEAYARLGFTQKEILDLTGATINGSVAMNSELAATAELTGAVVNSFDDLDTSDANEIIDQMAASTSKSALNFEKLSVALPIVSGAANAANVPFSETLALLGKLADAGIDASTASTSLRNIFIESAAQGKSYKDLIDQVANSTDRLTEANDLFGKRGAVAAVVLSKNIDATNDLNEALKGAGGTAEQMAEEQLDTLTGSLTLLSSAWDGFILSLEDGQGVFAKAVRGTIDGITSIVNSLQATNQASAELEEFTGRGYWSDGLIDPVDYQTLLDYNIALQQMRNEWIGLDRMELTQKLADLTEQFYALDQSTEIGADKAKLLQNQMNLLNEAINKTVDSNYTSELDRMTKKYEEQAEVVIDTRSELERLKEQLKANKEAREELVSSDMTRAELARLDRLKEEGKELENIIKELEKRMSLEEDLMIEFRGEMMKTYELDAKTRTEIYLAEQERQLLTERERLEEWYASGVLSHQDYLDQISALDRDERNLAQINNMGANRAAQDPGGFVPPENGGIVRQGDPINSFFGQVSTALNGYDEELTAERIQAAQMYADTLTGIHQTYIDGVNDRENRALNQFLEHNEERKNALRDRFEDGKMSEEAYNSEMRKLQEKEDRERARVMQQQFRRQQIADSIQAGINGALAVTKAIAMFGPPPSPAGIAAIVSAGLTTSASIAAIMSKQPPEFEQGGSFNTNAGVVQGASHAQGGVDMIDSATGRKVGEMEGGEVYHIYSKETVRNNRPIMDQLLNASLYGGGRQIGVPMRRAGGAPMFAEGGVVSTGSMDAASMIDELKALRKDIQGIQLTVVAEQVRDKLNQRDQADRISAA